MKRGKSDLCFVFFPVCSSSRSGRSDRLAHLPLGSGHPEEDRAGQGVLTAPPAGLQRCNTDQDTDTETESRRTDGWMDGGRSLTAEANSLVSFSLSVFCQIEWETNGGRTERFLNRPKFLIPPSPLSSLEEAPERNLKFTVHCLIWCQQDGVRIRHPTSTRDFFYETELEQRRGRCIESGTLLRGGGRELPSLSLSPAYVNVRCAECSLEDLWSSRCSRGVMMKRHEGFLKEYATQNLFSYQLLPGEKMFAQRAWDGTSNAFFVISI